MSKDYITIEGKTRDIEYFVSYARKDDQVYASEGIAWITTFVKELDAKYDKVFEAFAVDDDDRYFDIEPTDNKSITNTLKRKLEKSLFLIVFYSEYYVKSDWCEKERDHFLEVNSSNYDGRIFLIKLEKVRNNEYPARLRDNNKFQFYTDDDPTDIHRLPYPTEENRLHISNGNRRQFGKVFRRLIKVMIKEREDIKRKSQTGSTECSSNLESSQCEVLIVALKSDEDLGGKVKKRFGNDVVSHIVNKKDLSGNWSLLIKHTKCKVVLLIHDKGTPEQVKELGKIINRTLIEHSGELLYCYSKDLENSLESISICQTVHCVAVDPQQFEQICYEKVKELLTK